jgi:hypothetical protein
VCYVGVGVQGGGGTMSGGPVGGGIDRNCVGS